MISHFVCRCAPTMKRPSLPCTFPWWVGMETWAVLNNESLRKKISGRGKSELGCVWTSKRNCVGAGKHLFTNSSGHMFWEILVVSEVSEFSYRRMTRYFWKGKLRVNRLCLLEAPGSRCWDRVRSRRRLSRDRASQGSRGRRWAWAGWASDQVQVGLSPCALSAPRCTVTAGAACREGPEASQKVPAPGESATCIFADEQPVLFWRETWAVLCTLPVTEGSAHLGGLWLPWE